MLQNIVETFVGSFCAIGVGLLFVVLFAARIASIHGTYTGQSPLTDRRGIEKKHDTFTNEEIELPGVDIRRKNARRHIEVSRWAVENGATPAKLYGKFVAGMEERRRLEITEPDPEKRKRLRG